MAAGIHEATLAVGMSSGTVLGGVLGSQIGPRSPWFLAATVLLALVGMQMFAWRRWQAAMQREVIPVAGE
jgi:predicted MFS family arabinose efflux permease